MMNIETIVQVIALAQGVKLKITTDFACGLHSKECHECKFRRNVPGNAHIECVKPDVNMSGDKHGIINGWFMYPTLFDPTWKTKKCVNATSVNRAISQETKVD